MGSEELGVRKARGGELFMFIQYFISIFVFV